MQNENPHFSFSLDYAGTTVDCKVVMTDTCYEVIFDGRAMGAIAHTDSWEWIQESGVILPDDVIEEIGFRVESEYK